jgi:hypothetical protein
MLSPFLTRVSGGVEIETTMSDGEGPSSGRPHTPGIKENRNVKQCRNWIHAQRIVRRR